jgi:FdhD protein
MRTPGHDFELAAGFLMAEGIVSRSNEILRIEHCREVRSAEEEGNVVIVRTTAPAASAVDRARRLTLTTSSCGLCGKGSIDAVRGSFPRIPAGAATSPATPG